MPNSLKKGLSRRTLLFCSWVTPDTEITRCAKPLFDVEFKVISRTSLKRIVQSGRKVLHASLCKINQIESI